MILGVFDESVMRNLRCSVFYVDRLHTCRLYRICVRECSGERVWGGYD